MTTKKSSEDHSMDGHAEVDEFVVEGKETGKQSRSYDFTPHTQRITPRPLREKPLRSPRETNKHHAAYAARKTFATTA